MSRVLPILFNAEMVQAILDGRKTVTRRVVPGTIILKAEMEHTVTFFPYKPRKDRGCEIRSIKYFTLDSFTEHEAPYHPGDILYVRETWCSGYDGEDYFYLADKNTEREQKRLIDYDDRRWHPSIHMPKEAARIWLKVTNVRVERLQEMWASDTSKEGIYFDRPCSENEMLQKFATLWNSTLKKSDLDRYGWDANPWVWVIEFERCDKPEN